MRKLLPLLLVLAAACSHERRNDNAFDWSRDLAAGGTLRIRNTNGTITVVPAANGRTTRVHASTRWRRGNPARDLRFVAATQGGDATICVHWGTGTCTATEYTNRRLRFFGLFPVRGTDARVDFTVEVAPGTRVDVSSVNGELNVASQSPVAAHTVNGNVFVATAIGPATGETVNGTVDVRMTTIGGSGDVRATTTNGSASLYVPGNVDGAVTMHTVNGTVKSWFPLPSSGKSVKHLEGVLGTGVRPLVVRTVNGSVTLGALDAQGKVIATPAP